MSRWGERVDRLRSGSMKDATRLVWRKLVYRKVRMGRYGYVALDAIPPKRPCDLSIEIWGPNRFTEVLGTNDQISRDDIEGFLRARSSCIVALDGPRIAASSWMTSGDVWVKELSRTVFVPDHEHFSCRSWVSPDYRGRSLLSHMVYCYTQTIPAWDEIWGFIYYWNVASVRSLANIGWQLYGDYWTTHMLGRKYSGEIRFPPRPAFDENNVVIP